MSLNTSDFTRDEVRRRMVERAANIWQMRVRDVDTADPLVGYLMDACAFEFENTSKVIESTRQRIIDRLASVMCPEVIDLPRPAHAIVACRPESPVVDLSESAQFFHRQPSGGTEGYRDVMFSPVIKTRLVNAEVKFILTEQEVFHIRGRDRLSIHQLPQFDHTTSYQSVWLGLEVDKDLSSLSDLCFYFDWENKPHLVKAAFCRKVQDKRQTSWWLNDQPLQVRTGIHSPLEEAGYEQVSDTAYGEQRIARELDGLWQLESEVISYYEQSFVTLENIPSTQDYDYTRLPYPSGFELPDQLVQRFFTNKLLWLEIRFRRDVPKTELSKMDVRTNCFPVMNRRKNENYQRLQQSINVYPLISPEEFLFMKRVYYADGSDLYRSSPIRNAEEMEHNSFMYRAQGVGRFDVRDAREVLHYVQQLLREENRAFSALGTGAFTEIIDSLTKNLNELKVKLDRDLVNNFKIGHPYIFVKPRDESDSNVYIEFWSTNGAGGNGIRAGSKINLHDTAFGLDESSLLLLTDTVAGRDKPEITEKELILRRTLLTRNRLVTPQDVQAACQTFFHGRAGDQVIRVEVEKGFADGLIEGAGYVRCLDVWIIPSYPEALSADDWDNECERCRHHLTSQSSAILPYRVRVKQ